MYMSLSLEARAIASLGAPNKPLLVKPAGNKPELPIQLLGKDLKSITLLLKTFLLYKHAMNQIEHSSCQKNVACISPSRQSLELHKYSCLHCFGSLWPKLQHQRPPSFHLKKTTPSSMKWERLFTTYIGNNQTIISRPIFNNAI